MNFESLKKKFTDQAEKLNVVMVFTAAASKTTQVLAPQLYHYLPAGTTLRNHLASFAFAYIAPIAIENKPFPLNKWFKGNLALSASFCAATLTVYELINQQSVSFDPRYSGRFDWADMAAYAAALSLYYGINYKNYLSKGFEDNDLAR